MNISNRINIVLALLAVFLLILGTNRIDKRHFDTAQNAINSVYNDRVLAQNYIYKLNNLIHKKENILSNGSQTAHSSINTEIETLINLYFQTKFTTNERKTFNKFVSDFYSLKEKESKYYQSVDSQEGTTNDHIITDQKTPLQDEVGALKSDLDNLALIQVSETKIILSNAQKSLDINNLMSSAEIYFLIIVGILIIIVIFYRIEKSKLSR